MSDSNKKHASPSDPDGDGVRIIPLHAARARAARAFVLLALVLLAAGSGYLLYPSPSSPTASGDARPEPAHARAAIATTPASSADRSATADQDNTVTPSRAPSVRAMPTASNPADLRSGDDNDIATYVSPDDPEPTMAEVIQALRDSGDHGGLAAFNPPGTSPPLQGLAVPEDFVLPPGYVRHHQVTDDGQPIEAILMYAPDFVPLDADGRPIAVPEDRVVPPEMAPPGLPIRPITIPPPPQ